MVNPALRISFPELFAALAAPDGPVAAEVSAEDVARADARFMAWLDAWLAETPETAD